MFTEWCKRQNIKLRFIQPDKPDQNAYIERFNRTYRDEVLSAYLFDSLDEVREITAEWLDRYNEIRQCVSAARPSSCDILSAMAKLQGPAVACFCTAPNSRKAGINSGATGTTASRCSRP